LVGLAVSVQESLTDFILKHRLGSRYQQLDDDLTERRAGAVAMDKATKAAREVLQGAAAERSKFAIGDQTIRNFFNHRPEAATFVYGPRAAQE
jgi:hypothetical protein